MSGVLARWKQSLLDSAARKPSGWFGRFVYGRLAGVDRMGQMALERLDLRPDDVHLELAQGGGALLSRALETVARAAAIDHSADMVELAKRKNREALEEGRVKIVQGDAATLPWPEDSFTCGACTASFLFFEDPVRVLREVERVLKPGGRFVMVTPAQQAKGLIGTVFAPWASSMRLYTETEMEAMLAEAGFTSAEVKVVGKRLLCYAEADMSSC
jgi:ubiquinone/menaquinone biosynthesis C-methylase UbiE